MHPLIVAVAQYAIVVVALGAVATWLLVSRRAKVALGIQAVVTIVLVAVLVKVGAALHTDPRPFVVDPGGRPLCQHAADNGSPSDHVALATAVAALVTCYRRSTGIALLVLSVLIGAARVAAHVHHWQDIAGGLAIGVVAAAIALLTWAGWKQVRARTAYRRG